MFVSSTRVRRLNRTRKKLVNLCITRLAVHRTPQHIYAQIISPHTGKVLAVASSLEADIRKLKAEKMNKTDIAAAVGKLLAERAVKNGFADKIAFDRAGNLYHGRIKALAEAARANGLKF